MPHPHAFLLNRNRTEPPPVPRGPAADSDERAPFLRAIIAAPDDDLPRMIYADWLDERGDPRGEFIRLQLEHDRLPSSHPDWPVGYQRMKTLIDEHRHDWSRGCSEWVSDYAFRRGFIEELVVVTDAFLESAAGLFAIEPVTRVKFREAAGWIGPLARRRELGRLQTLDLGYNGLAADDARTLASSPSLVGLLRLKLAGNRNLGDAGAAAIAAVPFHRLASLDLEACQLGPAGIRALAASPYLNHLSRIHVAENPLGDAGLTELLAAPFLGRLKLLDLSNTRLTDAGPRMLAVCSAAEAVVDLRLGHNSFGDAGLRALAGSEHWPNLRHLSLHGAGVSADAVRELLRSPLGRRLTSFGISMDTISETLASELRRRFHDRVF